LWWRVGKEGDEKKNTAKSLASACVSVKEMKRVLLNQRFIELINQFVTQPSE